MAVVPNIRAIPGTDCGIICCRWRVPICEAPYFRHKRTSSRNRRFFETAYKYRCLVRWQAISPLAGLTFERFITTATYIPPPCGGPGPRFNLRNVFFPRHAGCGRAGRPLPEQRQRWDKSRARARRFNEPLRGRPRGRKENGRILKWGPGWFMEGAAFQKAGEVLSSSVRFCRNECSGSGRVL